MSQRDEAVHEWCLAIELRVLQLMREKSQTWDVRTWHFHNAGFMIDYFLTAWSNDFASKSHLWVLRSRSQFAIAGGFNDWDLCESLPTLFNSSFMAWQNLDRKREGFHSVPKINSTTTSRTISRSTPSIPFRSISSGIWIHVQRCPGFVFSFCSGYLKEFIQNLFNVFYGMYCSKNIRHESLSFILTSMPQ